MRGIDSSKNFWSPASGPTHQDEARNRTEYQTTHSRKALRWLIANKLDAGMSLEDVSHIIGQDGELEQNSGWLKRKHGAYRVDDKAYRFGPDDKGESVYLFFREGKLVNFDPKQFADVGPDFKSSKR
jgi:hypothetical protein